MCANAVRPLEQLPDSHWGLAANPVIKPLIISRGTMLSIDLGKTRALCEEVLGFQCAMLNSNVMFCRQRADAGGDRPYWVLEVHAVQSNPTPQRMYNHWGIWVPEVEDVDTGYALLTNNMQKYGIARVQKPRYAHQDWRDYSTYFEDISGNWWEIDRHPVEEEFIKYFNSGDWDSRESAGMSGEGTSP